MDDGRTFLACACAAIVSCGGSNGAEAPDAANTDATALRDADVSFDAQDEVAEARADVDGDATEAIADAAADASVDALDVVTGATGVRDATLPPAHCDSVVWSKVPGSPGGYGIMGSGPFDLWLIAIDRDGDPCNLGVYYNGATAGAGCQGGQLMHGDGVTWSPVVMPDAGDVVNMVNGHFYGPAYALWVAGHDDVWVSGNYNALAHWDGAGWRDLYTGDNREVDSFWGNAPDDLWSARIIGSYLSHWDGTQLFHFGTYYGGLLAGGASGDLWQAGDFDLHALDGGSLVGIGFLHHAPPSNGNNFDKFVALSSTDCGAMDGQASAWEAGWASATDDVWFVGDRAYHYDGATWGCVPTPTSTELHGVWGTAKTDVWAVGDAGTILHFDGTRWSSVPSPATRQLLSVWASGPCDVWAIGSEGVYHGQPGPSAADGGGADGS